MLSALLSRLRRRRHDGNSAPLSPPAGERTRSKPSSTAPASGGRIAPLQPGPDDMAEVRPGLFVGSSFAAGDAGNLTAVGIEHVLTLTFETMETTTRHAGIYDGLNGQADFDEAVEAARDLLGEDGVLIHCAAGVSRAPTVTATALAAEEGCSFATALATIRRHRPQVNPNPMMRRHGRAYLGEGERPDE